VNSESIPDWAKPLGLGVCTLCGYAINLYNQHGLTREGDAEIYCVVVIMASEAKNDGNIQPES
jgi:hypothetical protein